MAACGDSYKIVFKTETGRTWEDPWFLAPGPFDYVRWKLVAERATERMWSELERLGKIEEELGRGYPHYNALNDAAADTYNRKNALPHPLVSDDTKAAPEAVQIVKDASCVLEQIDAAILEYGRKPSTSKSETGKKGGLLPGLDGVVPWLAVAVIVAGAWYLDKRSDDEGG